MAGELRARDVRYKLKGRVDPEVVKVLEELAEQQYNLAKSLGVIVTLVDQMADITKNYVGVAEQMKKVIDQMKGNEEVEDRLKQ